MTEPAPDFTRYQLDDRYTATSGPVFMTGTQALARIMLDQARRDRTAGVNTAGFISGYRGSPLGGLDQELWRIADRLDQARIRFLPAVNEDLAPPPFWVRSRRIWTRRRRSKASFRCGTARAPASTGRAMR